MERRQFLMNGLAAGAAVAAPSLALPTLARANTGDAAYHRDEILSAGSDFLGVTAEALGGAFEKIFMDYGDAPTAYIAGEEVSGAIGLGLRYGKGLVHMKSMQAPTTVYWQGPSAGFDGGVNASRVFTLAYFLDSPDQIFRRFPGVEGSAYFVGGLGVNYQRAEGIVLAPIRAGVGFRLGANVGWLAYSRRRNILPF
ncbi:MAG: EipA family protein [Asticcacaulis sp.]